MRKLLYTVQASFHSGKITIDLKLTTEARSR